MLVALFLVFSDEDGVNRLATDDIVEMRFLRAFRIRPAESCSQMFAYSWQRPLLHGLAAALLPCMLICTLPESFDDDCRSFARSKQQADRAEVPSRCQEYANI